MTKTTNEPNSIPMKSIAEQLGIEERIIKNRYISGRSNTITGLGEDALLENSVDTYQIFDDAINTAKILDDSVTDDKLDYPRWYQELGRTTLTTAGDTITVSSIPARKYLKIIISWTNTGGAVSGGLRFNGDTGTNYAFRYTANTVNGSGLSATSFASFGGETGYAETEVLNVASLIKVGKAISTSGNSAAGTAPDYVDFWIKWVNTSAQINSVTFFNAGAGDFAIGSEVVVLGKD